MQQKSFLLEKTVITSVFCLKENPEPKLNRFWTRTKIPKFGSQCFGTGSCSDPTFFGSGSGSANPVPKSNKYHTTHVRFGRRALLRKCRLLSQQGGWAGGVDKKTNACHEPHIGHEVRVTPLENYLPKQIKLVLSLAKRLKRV